MVDSIAIALVKDTTPLVYATCDPDLAGSYTPASIVCLCDGDGDPLKLQWKIAAGNTATMRVTASWSTPTITAFAV